MYSLEAEKYTSDIHHSVVGEAEFFYDEGDSIYCVFSKATVIDHHLISAGRKTDMQFHESVVNKQKEVYSKLGVVESLLSCQKSQTGIKDASGGDDSSVDNLSETVDNLTFDSDGNDDGVLNKSQVATDAFVQLEKVSFGRSEVLRNDTEYLWLVGLKFDEYWEMAGRYIINASWLSSYGSSISDAAKQDFETVTLQLKPENLLKCHRSLVDYKDIVFKSNPDYQPSSWNDLFMMHSYAVKELAKKDFCEVKKSSALARAEYFVAKAKMYGFVPGFEVEGNEFDTTSSTCSSAASDEGEEKKQLKVSAYGSLSESVDQETSKKECENLSTEDSYKNLRKRRRSRELINYNKMEMFDDVYANFFGRSKSSTKKTRRQQKVICNKPKNNDGDNKSEHVSLNETSDNNISQSANTDTVDIKNYENFDFGFDEERDATLIARKAFNMLNGDSEMRKYWVQRYRLFSKINEGILMDREGWFSVTPEAIAKNIANRIVLKKDAVVVDAFAGVGGNSIQMALSGAYVIAIDLNPIRIRCAVQNAKVYGVANRINFICADFFHFAKKYSAEADATSPFDAVFLSPPWGGPSYLDSKVFDLNSEITPNGFEIFSAAKMLSPNIAYFLPRQTSIKQLISLAGKGSLCEIEHNLFNKKIKSITAYYGNLVSQ